MKTFLPENETEQVALGVRLSAACGDKALIFLQGDLGAGKTTLVRGLVQSRGHQGNVKSPTYTLIEPYETDEGAIYHLDLYRLSDGEELEYLGLREMLAESAIILIEWPQRAEGYLPTSDLLIQLSYLDSGRQVEITANTPLGNEILTKI